MGVYFHEVMCHAEKLVHYLQCQGHSEGLYNQNVTIFVAPSKLLFGIVQHCKLECPMEKWDYCI